MTKISGGFDQAELSELGVKRFNLFLLKFLITSQEEFNDFVENYWEGSSRQVFAVAKYRAARIKQNHVPLADFEAAYRNDAKSALEHMFAHPIHQSHIEHFERLMSEGSWTLEKLYIHHMEDPTALFLAVIPH